ncbi:MAG: serine/threonine protein phosphatase [Flavobacteriales bacterium]|nr:serine/threonine protein phosphatase [Flavobacteriales bacterium]|tara:strand:- start:58 stop:762 length:705 start_codon:yes stop_codon:yes gene_type:complete
MSEVRKLILTDSKKKAKRRFAISDIHGCYKTFQALISQIALKKEDYLFILGDAVNRGPDSAAILDEILRLKMDGYQIFYLRGNHEQAILDSIEKKPKLREKLIRNHNNGDLFDERIIKEKYHKLLEESYHYIETEDYFLVHAGFDFSKAEPFEDSRSMLFINRFKAKKGPLKNKKVVVGHKPKSLSKILLRLASNKRKIYIDNGCVNHQVEGMGNLLCFNLDTRALSIQRNLDL